MLLLKISQTLFFLSQFGDIYQEDYFIDYLKPDIRIVKELPMELQSLDLEAMGSMVRLICIYSKYLTLMHDLLC